MILQFVNKQRLVSATQMISYQNLCKQVFDIVESSSFLDKRLRKSDLVLSCSVNFVGSKYMRQINKQYRQIDHTTDVLTFPLLSMESGKLIHSLQASDYLIRKDQIIEVPLGEVLISLEKAAEQASEYGHSIDREVAFLATHAALHLLGFDHENEEDEKKMILKQKMIMRQIDLEKDTDETEETRKSVVPLCDALLPHSGFVAIIGRPNVGKSTLINQISGMKLAIVSSKPQTTRKNIRSVINTADSQIVFVDTPGIHRPKSALAEYMVDVAFRAAKDSDLILMLVDATKGLPSHVEIESCKRAKASGQKVILAINKADDVAKESLLPLISRYYDLYAFIAIIPISARTGDGVEELLSEIRKNLPSGPRFFPEDTITDQSERTLSAEMIREQILRFTNEEIPHGTAVEIVKFEEKFKEGGEDEYDRDLIIIKASIICEKASHRAILLGKQGQMIKRLGTRARENIEKMCGCKVFLDIHIKVRKDWKNKPEFLQDLGYRKED